MTNTNQELRKRLREHALLRGSFTLSSGKKSDTFLDCKQVTMSAHGLELTCEAFEIALRPWLPYTDAIAGVALGGCPLATGLAHYIASRRGTDMRALYVRNDRKIHGTKRSIEGPTSRVTRVVLLEDVITTGASTLYAVECLSAFDIKVNAIACIVDRFVSDEDRKAFSDTCAPAPLLSLFTLKEIAG